MSEERGCSSQASSLLVPPLDIIPFPLNPAPVLVIFPHLKSLEFDQNVLSEEVTAIVGVNSAQEKSSSSASNRLESAVRGHYISIEEDERSRESKSTPSPKKDSPRLHTGDPSPNYETNYGLILGNNSAASPSLSSSNVVLENADCTVLSSPVAPERANCSFSLAVASSSWGSSSRSAQSAVADSSSYLSAAFSEPASSKSFPHRSIIPSLEVLSIEDRKNWLEHTVPTSFPSEWNCNSSEFLSRCQTIVDRLFEKESFPLQQLLSFPTAADAASALKSSSPRGASSSCIFSSVGEVREALQKLRKRYQIPEKKAEKKIIHHDNVADKNEIVRAAEGGGVKGKISLSPTMMRLTGAEESASSSSSSFIRVDDSLSSPRQYPSFSPSPLLLSSSSNCATPVHPPFSSVLSRSSPPLLKHIRAPSLAEMIDEVVNRQAYKYEQSSASSSKFEQYNESRRNLLLAGKRPKLNRMAFKINDAFFIEKPNFFSENNFIYEMKRKASQLKSFQLVCNFNNSKLINPMLSQNHIQTPHKLTLERLKKELSKTGKKFKEARSFMEEEKGDYFKADLQQEGADKQKIGAYEVFSESQGGSIAGTPSIDNDRYLKPNRRQSKKKRIENPVIIDIEVNEAQEKVGGALKLPAGSISAEVNKDEDKKEALVSDFLIDEEETEEFESQLETMETGSCAVVTCSFYHPSRGHKMCEFEVLDNQTLADLRDAFTMCDEEDLSDEKMQGSLFFISSRLYPDLRENPPLQRSNSPTAYARSLLDYSVEAARISPYPPRPQHLTKISDLQLQLHGRCAFLHQGDCEHRVAFTSIRRFNKKVDFPYREGYPLLIFSPTMKIKFCEVCRLRVCSRRVFNSVKLPKNPTSMCDVCYSSFIGDGV